MSDNLILLPEIKYYTLENNFNLIYLYDKTSLFFCKINVDVGSKHEDMGSHGLAHFFEHMIFKGIATELPYMKSRVTAITDDTSIRESIDYIGAYSNASTSNDITDYYISGLDNEYEFIIRTLVQMILNPQFPEQDIENELQVVLEEYRMRQDNINLQFYLILMKLMYNKIDDNIYRDPVGTINDIMAITRDKLVDFHQEKYLQSQKTMIIITGIEENKILNVIKDIFPKIKTWIPEFIPMEHELIINNHKNIELPLGIIDLPYQQSVVKICFRGVNLFSSWLYAGFIVASILRTRLFTRLRDVLGLTYYQDAYQQLYEEHGLFIVEFGVRHDGVQSALFNVIDMLLNFKDVTEYELQKVKNHVERNFIGETEMIINIGTSVIDYVTSKKDPRIYENLRMKYSSMKEKHINNFAKKVFKRENMCVLIGGNKKELDTYNIIIE